MSAPVATPVALTRYLDTIEAALEAALPPSSELAEAARYAVGRDPGAPASARGKRIRPSLCLLTAECLGGSPAEALPAAVAIELAHNFSLVHDDIQDRDIERHGRPTAWRLHGEAQAINVGDFLYTRALSALAGGDAPADRRVAATDAILTALARMLHGQWNDIAFEDRSSVSEEEYLGMVADKTGALLGASFQAGALMAGAPAATAEALRAWGELLGLAFQVWDDYLGTWGDPSETGKSNASDIARKKRTLPIIMAMHREDAAAMVISREYGRDEPGVRAVVEALDREGIRHAMTAEAGRRAEETIAAATALPLPTTARDELIEVANYLVMRNR